MFFSSKISGLSEADINQLKAYIGELLGLENHSDLTLSQNTEKTCLVRLPFVADSIWTSVAEKASEFVQHTFAHSIRFEREYNVPIFEAKQNHVKNVKNIIAVASGKGGVGKSASALNLAIALQLEGARVGILDADIYGPSIPIMLGTQNQRPESPDNKIMQPIVAHGLASNSIGYLVQNDHASIWRGPMASKALSQLLKETAWPMLDYLIVDMPPGTGDIQLTMCQQLPLTAAVVVTTPQDIALSDAAKGIAMFEKLAVPVLGIIENMSYFECGNCHHKTAIFSEKGALGLSEKYALPLLAQVPLNPIIREYADSGKSLLHEQVQHDISVIYRQCAIDLSRQLCESVKLSAMASKLAGSIQVTQLDA
ncbi:iron-sulfur cluster carrier protein ApbC [Glaciecola petra]|uniref:Iron-sulfur cluster carrier protein n=1 Tax=Glaciecola petra TaxID=3075602 RepID=A0ABU2ZPK3_9ALTE|nr:iron-sulfur cluster carrier protein ApbC [Aestuariibacter sp. P117]MDT0594556.1 iron-sulfur cluster carrier protein ApbC [Aestuariibacter sp. P117]